MSLIAKHKRQLYHSEGDYLKGSRQSKLACLGPSKVNNPSIYKALQESCQNQLLDDCPRIDTDLPPYPLMYCSFREFQDFIKKGLFSQMDILTEIDNLY